MCPYLDNKADNKIFFDGCQPTTMRVSLFTGMTTICQSAQGSKTEWDKKTRLVEMKLFKISAYGTESMAATVWFLELG